MTSDFIDLRAPVPDLCEALVGYRVWQWDAERHRLLSLYNSEIWEPYATKRGDCMQRGGRVPWVHAAHCPHEECTCGIYAFASLHDLIRQRDRPEDYLVLGQVFLWGRVIEHEKGWRAEYAYPRLLNSQVAADRYGVPYEPSLRDYRHLMADQPLSIDYRYIMNRKRGGWW